jgi:lipopolysaccharide/colanic/teichoic acid biosynthesis glycosyltransferase
MSDRHHDPITERRLERALKRGLDVALAGAGLAALAPALATIAIAIRLDSPGDALFVQERVGRQGRVFRLLKFRTMTAGAPVQFNADGSTRVAASDARVTRVGKHLRGALDELPQLVNVLLGDMSLVGPRPDLPVHAEQYTARERDKLRVRPGITSLAAVLGRNELYWKRRIAIDLEYIDRWSLALDAKVLLATFALPFGVEPFGLAQLIPDHPSERAAMAEPSTNAPHDGAPGAPEPSP